MDSADISPDTNQPQPNEATLLKDLGQRLRQAREARGESLDDIVRELKLRKVYLQALERGDWEALPDQVYALGFLRQYAAHLKLDVEDDIHRLKHDTYRLTRPLTFPDPPVAPSRLWAWIAGLTFVLLLIGLNVYHSGSRPEAPETEPPRVSEKTVHNPAATSPPSVPATAETAPESSPEAPSSGTPTPAVEEKAIRDIADQATTEMPAAAPESVDEALPQSPEEVKPILPLHRYRFEAVDDDVWLQVFLPDDSGSAKGELRKEVLLRAGHHLELNEAAARLWVTTGNAGALAIHVDRKLLHAAGSLGERGRVLRDFIVRAEE